MPNVDVSNFYLHKAPTVDGFSHLSIGKSNHYSFHGQDQIYSGLPIVTEHVQLLCLILVFSLLNGISLLRFFGAG